MKKLVLFCWLVCGTLNAQEFGSSVQVEFGPVVDVITASIRTIEGPNPLAAVSQELETYAEGVLESYYLLPEMGDSVDFGPKSVLRWGGVQIVKLQWFDVPDPIYYRQHFLVDEEEDYTEVNFVEWGKDAAGNVDHSRILVSDRVSSCGLAPSVAVRHTWEVRWYDANWQPKSNPITIEQRTIGFDTLRERTKFRLEVQQPPAGATRLKVKLREQHSINGGPWLHIGWFGLQSLDI